MLIASKRVEALGHMVVIDKRMKRQVSIGEDGVFEEVFSKMFK